MGLGGSMKLSNALSKRIFELAIKNYKTFYELSKLSGVPTSTIRSIASGSSKNPKIENIEKIASVFNMSLRDFFDDESFG